MKTLLSIVLGVLFMSLMIVQEVKSANEIEVFDIQKGEVVRLLNNTADIQVEVKNWVSSISGISGRAKIEPDNGIAIKIPLTPPLKVKNKWVSDTVTEVVLFVSHSPAYYPTLLLLTTKNKMLAVFTDCNYKEFLKRHNLYDSNFYLKSFVESGNTVDPCQRIVLTLLSPNIQEQLGKYYKGKLTVSPTFAPFLGGNSFEFKYFTSHVDVNVTVIPYVNPHIDGVRT